jgi:predicted nucleic acid-binding protein
MSVMPQEMYYTFPFIERKNAIIEWKKIAAEKIEGTKIVVARASEFTRNGLKAKDALHIACAIEGKAEYFLTTDDNLIKKLAKTKELIVINPVNFIPILESI